MTQQETKISALVAALEAALFALSTIGPDGIAALDSSASTGTNVRLEDAIRSALATKGA